MLRLVAFGLAVGAGVQAWRNFPPDGPLSGDSVAVVFLVGLLCAFFGGRALRGSGGASASAVASAEASSVAAAQNSTQVNLVVMPGQGAGSARGVSVPDSSSVSWMGERPVLASVDDLDGMDLLDLGVTEEVEYGERQ